MQSRSKYIRREIEANEHSRHDQQHFGHFCLRIIGTNGRRHSYGRTLRYTVDGSSVQTVRHRPSYPSQFPHRQTNAGVDEGNSEKGKNEHDKKIRTVEDVVQVLVGLLQSAHENGLVFGAIHAVFQTRNKNVWHVKKKRSQSQTRDDHLRPRHGAHRGPFQRITHGYESFDGERDDEPDAEKTAHGRQVNGKFAENRLIEYGYVDHVEPGYKGDHEKSRVADGESRQVEAGRQLSKFRAEKHDDRKPVADGAERHQKRHVIKFDFLEDFYGVRMSLIFPGGIIAFVTFVERDDAHCFIIRIFTALHYNDN